MAGRCVPDFDRVVVSRGGEPIGIGTENDRIDWFGVTRLNYQFGLRIGSGLIGFGSYAGSLWYLNAAVLSLPFPRLSDYRHRREH